MVAKYAAQVVSSTSSEQNINISGSHLRGTDHSPEHHYRSTQQNQSLHSNGNSVSRKLFWYNFSFWGFTNLFEFGRGSNIILLKSRKSNLQLLFKTFFY